MIHINEYFINNPKGTIIIVHGIAEHSGRYEKLASKLNLEGFDVYTYDLLGHGKSSGKRGKIKSFNDHIDTLHEVVLKARIRNSNKIFLLGHSMGGGIVNMYAVTYKDIDGIVSVAAATKTPKNAIILKIIGFWYLRWIKLSTKMFDKHLAKDPTVLLKNKKDPLMLKHFYIGLIGEMFIKGVRYINDNINEFTVPVLYIHGSMDKIVDVKASIEMFDKVKSKDKEIKIYDGEFHELLNDYNASSIMGDIFKWLKKRS